ncbi:MAG TPA: hypothetical protein VK786_00285, partial [bacterium]|nr:hypothetical protein [bacterium]
MLAQLILHARLAASDEPILEVIPPPPASAIPILASGTASVSGTASALSGTASIPPPPAAAARLALPQGLAPLPAAKDGLSMPGYLTA